MIEKEYRHPGFSLQDAADGVSLSAGYLGRLFKQTAGQSFVEALTACRLKNTSVHEVRFDKANFYRTSLKGIDLTTCRISGIITSLEAGELKGAVVNMFQAVELAKRFGVIVR